MSFRLVIHPRMDGRLAMALDEILTDAVGEGKSPPIARLYGFSPPALSVGRFQRIHGGVDRALLAADGVMLVRRPTGGHAVLHDDELTYSVILSKAGLDATLGSHRKREVYGFIAGALLAGLDALGIKGLVNARQAGDPRNPDCFGSSGEYEITDGNGRKLIGSAQMTTRSAVLQQGSIPISLPAGRTMRYLRGREAFPDARAPTCLTEAAGRPLGFEEARNAFAAAFRRLLFAEETPVTAGEEYAARRLAAEKYAGDEWNLRT